MGSGQKKWASVSRRIYIPVEQEATDYLLVQKFQEVQEKQNKLNRSFWYIHFEKVFDKHM